MVVLALSFALVPTLALVLALTLFLTLPGLSLRLAALARRALTLLPPPALALVSLRIIDDLAPLIEGTTLLGFSLLLRPHLGLLAPAHLVLPHGVSSRLTQLTLMLTLEGAALLTHTLIETSLLRLLTLDGRARRYARSRHKPRPLRPHSGNSRAIDFDRTTLDRNLLQIGPRT
ncbi:MAG TPA: hypothetical protein VGJ98_09525 [Candidatus Eisenbacteria bacterium]